MPESATAQSSPSVFAVLTEAMTATMLDFGIRTGLLPALASRPASADELALATGGDPRMAAEWAAALTAAGMASHALGTFTLNERIAQEVIPVPPVGPPSVVPGIALFSALAASVDPAVAAYRHGGRADPASYPGVLATAMDQMSQQWTSQVLPHVWLRGVDGLSNTLEHGGSVSEIGCGSGSALIAVARSYPSVRATGYELDPAQVASAREAIDRAGVGDRVVVEQSDATTSMRGPDDLILALNVLHDATDLDALLGAAAAALAPNGTLLVAESRSLGAGMDAMLLATSTLFCVPTTRHRGGTNPMGTLGLTPLALAEAATRSGFDSPVEVANPVPMLSVHALAKRPS